MTHTTERGLPERIARNREIARLRDEEGLPWDAIATRLQISRRTATRGYSDHIRSTAPESLADVNVELIVLADVGEARLGSAREPNNSAR